MLRRRILEKIFKFSADKEIFSFEFGITSPPETITEYGRFVDHSPLTANIDNEIYYKISGTNSPRSVNVGKRNGSTWKTLSSAYVNVCTYNFKTTSENQQVIFDFIASCESPNDYLGATKLDNSDIWDLAVNVTGTNKKTYTYNVSTPGDHFIKIYYYQHNDGTISNGNCGYFKMRPYSIINYEYRYTAPNTQTVKLTSYYGWNLVSKPSWIKLYKQSNGSINEITSDISGVNTIIIEAKSNPSVRRTGEIKLKEKYGTQNITLSVSQEENPHPNDIILSFNKITAPVGSNIVSTLNVELVGNTSYTISNVSPGLTINPMSGNGNITINNNQSSNTNGIFRITGNAGTVKDVVVNKERAYCYCDCNLFDGCGCDVESSFSKKDDVSCPTNKCTSNTQISCPKHCEAYGSSNICPSHTTCSCNCQSEVTTKSCNNCTSHNSTKTETCNNCTSHNSTKTEACDCNSAYSSTKSTTCDCNSAYSNTKSITCNNCTSHTNTKSITCNCNSAYSSTKSVTCNNCASHNSTTSGTCDCNSAYSSTKSTTCDCNSAYSNTKSGTCDCNSAYSSTKSTTCNNCTSHSSTKVACSCDDHYLSCVHDVMVCSCNSGYNMGCLSDYVTCATHKLYNGAKFVNGWCRCNDTNNWGDTLSLPFPRVGPGASACFTNNQCSGDSSSLCRCWNYYCSSNCEPDYNHKCGDCPSNYVDCNCNSVYSSTKSITCNNCTSHTNTKSITCNNCTSHTNTKSITCNNCTSHTSTKSGSCDCNSAYSSTKSITCNNCTSHTSTQSGTCDCNSAYSSTKSVTCNNCTSHNNTKSITCNNCTSHNNTKSVTCDCNNKYSSTRTGTCSCNSVHSTQQPCSKHSCNKYYPDSCSCNTKTYYPHCDCDNYCQCDGHYPGCESQTSRLPYTSKCTAYSPNP